jgi:hypothetical protein
VGCEPHAEEAPVYRDLTVAYIRTPDRADHVDVLFLESARIFKLARGRDDFDEVLTRLRASELEGHPVRVMLASFDSDVLDDVRAP